MGYITRKSQNGGQEIVISSWEKGIAPSPYSGINDIRAVNVNDIPGAVYASAKTTNNLLTIGGNDVAAYLGVARTFTADTATNYLTISGSTDEWNLTAVTFTTTSALPTCSPAISVGVTYYLQYAGVAGKYLIHASYKDAINNASAFDITTTGTGTQTATSVNIGVINYSAKDERTGNIFVIDSNQRVWCNSTNGGIYKWQLIAGNTLTSSYGNGIAVWQNYVFAFRGIKIDVYGPISNFSTATWTNDWQTMYASFATGTHKTFVASNNILYWTDFVNNTGGLRNQGYVGSLGLANTSVFDPASSATYIFNGQALDLPDNEQPIALNELNGYLAIGVNSSASNSSSSTSKLYYWDTTSPSFQNPLIVPEAPIYEIVNANNIIYVFCGWRGRVYKTNLATITEAFKIPDHMYYPGSSATGYEGLPLFGEVSRTTVGGTYKIIFGQQARITRKKIMFAVNMYGSTALWSYDSQTDVLQIEAKPINGYGASNTVSTTLTGVEITNGNALTTGGVLIFGQYYNTGTTTYTIEQYNPITSSNDANFGSYNGSITSDYINVGSANKLKTFQQLEYTLDRNMISGSGLKIYYRTIMGGAYTLLSTEDFATYGAISGRVIDFAVEGVEWIQIKIELNPFTILRDITLR